MAPKAPDSSALFVGEVHTQEGQSQDQQDERGRAGDQQPRVPGLRQRLPRHLAPEDDQPGERRHAEDENRCKQHGALEGEVRDPDGHEHEARNGYRCDGEANAHGAQAMLGPVPEANYISGDDYIVEFLGYRFGFNSSDFEQRVTAAAVKLGLVHDNELDDDETADLVELVERDWIDEPRSGLGRYLVRHWERLSLVSGESLVYWLKKLVFRGAWLDHRVKEGMLEVSWDERSGDFGYRDPNGDRALLELAPVPSWHELQFRR
jgi:hypothetical protein